MKEGKSDITIDKDSLTDKDSLINFDLKSFLESYSEKDILRLKKLFLQNYILLSEQLKIYPKAKYKLPTFAVNYCWFTTKSYEQSSSEALAEYKASQFEGNTLLDLTGGLGVDDWAFSRSFSKVISLDKDNSLNTLVNINFDKLGINNIERITADAEEYVKQADAADLVYIDADRRVSNKRSVTLEGASPPVLKILENIYSFTSNVLLKLSPLTDITYINRTLHHIKSIQVVSFENEVKEILVHLIKNYTGNAEIKAVDISTAWINEFSKSGDEEAEPLLANTGKYFYEPASSIIKAGLVNNYAIQTRLQLISTNCVYLLSDELKGNFFGRSFKIVEQLGFSKSTVKKYLKDNGIIKANIAKRNFPLSADEIKKLFKVSDGGNEYLFFTQNSRKEKIFFHCRKIAK